MEETPILRNPKWKNEQLFLTAYNEVRTLRDCLPFSLQRFPDNPCLGRRYLKKLHVVRTVVNGVEKDMEYPELTPIQYKTYREVMEIVQNISGNLLQWTGMKKGDMMGIYLDTCMEWQIMAQVAFRHGIILCTCYANLGEESLVHVVEECNLETMIVGSRNVKVLERLRDRFPKLKRLIIVRDMNDEGEIGSSMFEFVTYDELAVKKTPEPELPPLDPEDVAVIMYTSGSTGIPKGVVVPHRGLVSCSGSASDETHISESDVYIGYLPLAHILELVAETAFILRGASIGYGSPRTLNEKGVGPLDDPNRKGDIAEIRPTMMAGVPRVYGTIMKGVLETVEQSNFLKRWLFNTALSRRKSAVLRGETTPFWDWLVFGKLKERVGGRLRLMLSGGAPLGKEVQEFLHVTFGCTVIQGYGLTETCGGGAIQDPDGAFGTETIGFPFLCSEIKLVSVPDLGYSAKANPPQGELWIRGNNVNIGYYKRDDLTGEAWTNDGWFKTGDIATLNPNGTLSIIDRKKNLIKLAHGEYVAVESLEMIYSQSPFILAGGICVYADPFRDHCVAIALPQESYVKNWAKEAGLDHLPFNELLQHATFKEAVLNNLREIARNHSKKTFEQVANIYIANDYWGPENDLTTASFKLNRANIAKHYKSEIERLYAEL